MTETVPDRLSQAADPAGDGADLWQCVAELVGNPGAVRAAPRATNPLPIIVPCHRVLRADGSFGWRARRHLRSGRR